MTQSNTPWIFRKFHTERKQKSVDLTSVFKSRAIIYTTFQENGIFCDGTLRTEDGGTFRIHRNIITSASEYFRALYLSSLNLEPRHTVLVPGVRGCTMEEIIHYAYTCEISISSENVCDILLAADQFLMGDLVTECHEFMLNNIDINNCLTFYNVSHRMGHLSRENLQLKFVCYRFIQINFNKIVETTQTISELPVEVFSSLLKDNGLNAREDSVWRAITLWVLKEPQERLQHIFPLICCLRLEYMERTYITNILNHDLIREDSLCRMVIDRFLKGKTYLGEDNRELLIPSIWDFKVHTKFFEPRLPSEIMFFVQDFNEVYWNVQGSVVYEMYDNFFDCWKEIGYMADFNVQFLTSVNQKLYMFDLWNNIAFSFDFLQKRWEELPEMRVPRYDYSVVSVGGLLYAIGGVKHSPEYQDFPTVEAYDPSKNSWVEMKPMNNLRKVQTEAINDKIYAIGGIFQSEEQTNMIGFEQYDPERNKWTILPPPEVKKHDFAFVKYRSCLYTIGGNYNEADVLSVEKYDTVTQKWSRFTDLPYPYYIPKAIVLNDVLIVHDNFTEDYPFSKPSPPVYFDSFTNCWQKFSMKLPWLFVAVPHQNPYHHCIINNKDIIRELRNGKR